MHAAGLHEKDATVCRDSRAVRQKVLKRRYAAATGMGAFDRLREVAPVAWTVWRL